MELVRNIALAALLFLIFVVLTSGRSFGSTEDELRGPKRIESEAARKAAEIERVRAAEARKRELDRRCRIKTAMNDGEIAACRVAYRELGELSK